MDYIKDQHIVCAFDEEGHVICSDDLSHVDLTFSLDYLPYQFDHYRYTFPESGEILWEVVSNPITFVNSPDTAICNWTVLESTSQIVKKTTHMDIDLTAVIELIAYLILKKTNPRFYHRENAYIKETIGFLGDIEIFHSYIWHTHDLLTLDMDTEFGNLGWKSQVPSEH